MKDFYKVTLIICCFIFIYFFNYYDILIKNKNKNNKEGFISHIKKIYRPFNRSLYTFFNPYFNLILPNNIIYKLRKWNLT
jgi:hypothetical protein